MSNPVEYIRNRAEGLLSKATQTMDPERQDEYKHGARYLNLVADELDAEFHVDE